MTIEITEKKTDSTPLQPLMKTFLTEWRWWILGAIFSWLFASILLSGWPMGLLPNLSAPLGYTGDNLFLAWQAQRVIEGWIFDNPRSGYPFGSNFLDYPGSDSGSYIIIKLFGLLSGNYYSALTLCFLLSFPVTFISSFCVLRTFSLSKMYAASAALLFVFLPFHFLRIGHLFYTWYFAIPIFFYAGYHIFINQANQFLSWRSPILFSGIFLGFIILASFGVYYAFFGVIVLVVSAMAAWAKNRNAYTMLPALSLISIIIFGVLLNIGSNLIHKKLNGANLEVAIRSPMESEVYGFKLMQLILPRPDHRNETLRHITDKYNTHFPLINENSFSSLGVVGSAGFFLLGLLILVRLAGMKIDERLAFLALVVLVLFLFGTIGGLGSLFAVTVSPMIRGWNRISVFIAFGAISAFFLGMQLVIHRYFSPKNPTIILAIPSILIVCLGLYDQTKPNGVSNEHVKHLFKLDRDFINQIESSVPVNSAIYQLPYMRFPETAPQHRLHTYDLMSGFVHSRSLRWNYAGMKGREGDLFYRALAQEPIEKQLDVIKRLGFAGIYIDKRGFEDNAKVLIERLSVLLGKPPQLKRADDKVVFFRIDSPSQLDFSTLTSTQIMQKAGYVADKLGPRYPANLIDGIDFTRSSWPEFIRDVKGLSGYEPWGRWSDAKVASKVRLDFFSPLPQKFTLVLTARPFGPNVDHDLVIKIGEQEQKIKMLNDVNQLRIPFDLLQKSVDFIEFVPPNPTSPQQLGINSDARLLGIGFINLRIEAV
ncbi:DUF7024 domain-containing protein [Candidatus Regiella endosymbiont of Tuberolachnus salignus]|uniref:DUF7024 domain-containing protein n=1 Tax=Candidatus Regiella endosymbiont of Tuberolachnus salignus TaxID=3077956 RepID=UPI0030D58133